MTQILPHSSRRGRWRRGRADGILDEQYGTVLTDDDYEWVEGTGQKVVVGCGDHSWGQWSERTQAYIYPKVFSPSYFPCQATGTLKMYQPVCIASSLFLSFRKEYRVGQVGPMTNRTLVRSGRQAWTQVDCGWWLVLDPAVDRHQLDPASSGRKERLLQVCIQQPPLSSLLSVHRSNKCLLQVSISTRVPARRQSMHPTASSLVTSCT